MQAALVTVSHKGDFALAKELCASADAFVAPDIEHVLVVPASDAALFAPLAGGRRRIVTVEELLPKNFVRLLPSYQFGGRRLREVWLTPRGLVRGWIIQQIVKLSADRATNRELIVFADSDLVFVRPLTKPRLLNGDAVRLYQRPGETRDSPRHRAWHGAAAKLLGLPATDYFGADYIGNLICWRRDTLQALQAHIGATHRTPWQSVLAGAPNFSEYVLYGAFADYVLGAESGHYPDTDRLTHASWHYDQNAAGLSRFIADLNQTHIAVLIQSTAGLCVDERRRVIAQMIDELKRAA